MTKSYQNHAIFSQLNTSIMNFANGEVFDPAALTTGGLGPANVGTLGGLIVFRSSTGLKLGAAAAGMSYITVAPPNRQDIAAPVGGNPITDKVAFVNSLPQGRMNALALTEPCRVFTPAFDSGGTYAIDTPLTSLQAGATAGCASVRAATNPCIGFVVNPLPSTQNEDNYAISLEFQTHLQLPSIV